MSDTNTISLTYSKDLQPLIDTAINDFRQHLKDKAQNDLLVEQAKIKANKEKFDAALKMLNKNGAVDKLMLQVANKFMGEPVVPPKINKPSGKYSEDSKSTRAEKINLISLITELNELFNFDPDFRSSLNSVINNISVSDSIHNFLKCTSEDDARITLKSIQFNITLDDMPYLVRLNDMLNDSEKELVGKIFNFDA